MFELFIFILGTAIGSFLGVVIDRLPRDESLNGRSHCNFCKHNLGVLDLLPVISFILLNGKCRYCKRKLSWQYPFIEMLTGLLFVMVFIVRYPAGVYLEQDFYSLLAYLGIVSCAIVIFMVDLKKQIIPDEVQISLFLIVFLLKILQGVSVTGLGFGLVEGALVMVPILFLYLLTKGRGMGFGDVKLSFIVGFLLGLKSGLVALYIAFILGAIVGVLLLVSKKKKMKSKIAFGPYIILGMIMMLFWQETILQIIRNI